MKILIATGNKGKLQELQTLLQDTPITLVMPRDIGLDALDVEETGSTLEENAVLKAVTYAQHSGLFCLADDTGLFVDALDGQPGIYAARFGDPSFDDAGRRQFLLQQLGDTPTEARTARFACVIALANPHTLTCDTVTGVCEGAILTAERGHSGFGYDALFVPQGETRTFAELSDQDPAIKNRISHRGIATAKILPLLAQLAQDR